MSVRRTMGYFVAVVNGNGLDTYAAIKIGEALELANPDPGDKLDIFWLRAQDAGEARLRFREGERVSSTQYWTPAT